MLIRLKSDVRITEKPESLTDRKVKEVSGKFEGYISPDTPLYLFDSATSPNDWLVFMDPEQKGYQDVHSSK